MCILIPGRDNDPGVHANRDQLRSLRAARVPLVPLEMPFVLLLSLLIVELDKLLRIVFVEPELPVALLPMVFEMPVPVVPVPVPVVSVRLALPVVPVVLLVQARLPVLPVLPVMLSRYV